MNFDTQILFLFSALGAVNGLFLSIYFAFFTKQKAYSNYFLSALLFVLSIRIIKSVFFYFNPDLSQAFIQLGLSACLLIGPFLFLYTVSVTKGIHINKNMWYYHIIPFIIIISIAWFLIPYKAYKSLWSPYLVRVIYLQWLIYIIISGFYLKDTFKKLFAKNRKLNDFEVLLVSVFTGVTIIWVAYFTSRYTSYIVGALSFSFVFYILILLGFFKRNRNSTFFEKEVKYANKKIEATEAAAIANQLDVLMKDKELYKNPDLKLFDVAKELQIPPHLLSQFLNDNIGKGFSLFLNEYRIKAAEKLLGLKNHLTLEAIGQECGFKSNSTFYSAFKKIKGLTPAKFKRQLG